MRWGITSVVMDNPPGVLPRKFRKHQKGILGDMIRRWHSKYLPQHFQGSAFARYGYPRREAYYSVRKQKQKGHRRPLVFTGLLERQARRFIHITGTARKGTGTMAVPWYVRNIPQRVFIYQEMIKTTGSEAAAMGKYFEGRMGKKLNQRGPRKVVTL